MSTGDPTGYPFPPQNPPAQPCAIPQEPVPDNKDEEEEETE
jgi:hypothetical protein